MGHAIGDWDNDGNLDWFSSAIWHNRTECSVSGCKFDNSGNVLFRNLGGRRFEDATMQVISLTLPWLLCNVKIERLKIWKSPVQILVSEILFFFNPIVSHEMVAVICH